MEKIKVVILEGGKTAKEVNHYSRPDIKKAGSRAIYNRQCKRYFEFDCVARVFSIQNWLTNGWYPTYNNPDNSGCDPMAEPYLIPGDIREAQVINDKQVRIL